MTRSPTPVRWKLWVLLVASLYPVITVSVTLAEPILSRLPVYGRFALIVPVMAALMIWVVLPLIHRYLGAWLVRA